MVEMNGVDEKSCALNQFLEYIWKEQPSKNKDKPQDTTRPKVTGFALDYPKSDVGVNRFMDALNTVRGDTGFKMTGNSHNTMVVHDSVIFYDALAKAGTPIGIARQQALQLRKSSFSQHLPALEEFSRH